MAYLHVKATVSEYDEWKRAFDGYHSRRAEFGGRNYQLFQGSDDANEIVVLIEFETASGARDWVDYLEGEGELTDPSMSNVETSYLDFVERRELSVA